MGIILYILLFIYNILIILSPRVKSHKNFLIGSDNHTLINNNMNINKYIQSPTIMSRKDTLFNNNIDPTAKKPKLANTNLVQYQTNQISNFKKSEKNFYKNAIETGKSYINKIEIKNEIKTYY